MNAVEPEPGTADSRAAERARTRYLWLDQGIVAFGINMAINGLIAWLIFRDAPVLPLRGPVSLEADIIGTCVLMPIIACLIVTAVTRRQLRQGKLVGIAPDPPRRGWTGWLRGNVIARTVVLSLLFRMLVPGPTVWLLERAGVEELSLTNFILAKAVWAAMLGIVICPLCGWLAFFDVPPADAGSDSATSSIGVQHDP